MKTQCEIRIAESVRQKFPQVQVRQVELSQMRQARWQQIDFVQLQQQTLEQVRQRFASAGDDPLKVPEIASWRAAYKACGIKASKYRSSVEQLARRTHQDKMGDGAEPFVRLYCLLSAKHMVPLGAYDQDKLAAAGLERIELRMAQPTDLFEPLAGEAKDFSLAANVPVYAAEQTVLCWGFNHRDARPSAVDAQTNRALVAGEVTSSTQAHALEAALHELGELMGQAGVQVSKVTAGLGAAQP